MASGDFLRSPAFLYFKKMAMQSIGASWGKRCQQKSSAHRNLGAEALGRTLLAPPDKSWLCFGKGIAGYCTSSAHFPVALFFFQDYWVPWFIPYAWRKCCSWGTRTALFNLSGAVLGGLSKSLPATALIWTTSLLLLINTGQRVTLSCESQSRRLRKETCGEQKPYGHQPEQGVTAWVRLHGEGRELLTPP